MPGSQPPNPPPEVMTIDELAVYLQVSKSSLYKLAQDGRVPGQKVGRHWRFHRAAIDRWFGVQSDCGRPAAASRSEISSQSNSPVTGDGE